jgi:hypothetical protein
MIDDLGFQDFVWLGVVLLKIAGCVALDRLGRPARGDPRGDHRSRLPVIKSWRSTPRQCRELGARNWS